MKQILVVSHCILNTASKVDSNTIEDEETANRKKLIGYILKNDIQLIQLPCPEFIMYGAKRWGHVKNQFSHGFFRKQCRQLLEPVILQLKEYYAYPERFKVMAVVSIDGSPSCGYGLTCKGEWGGELSGQTDLINKIGSLRMEQEPGVYMEELKRLLEEEQIDLPIMDLSEIIKNYN